jgi:hypothetical protein
MLRNASTSIAAFAAVALFLSGCGGAGAPGTAPAVPSPTIDQAQTTAARAALVPEPPDAPSMLATLTTETTIGSAVDPQTGDQNPYGLDIAPSTWGGINQGDLVVCDFNDRANVQGTGNSIVALSPVPGSSPRHITSSARLKGCTENVQSVDGDIWTTAFTAPDIVEQTSSGAVLRTLSGSGYPGPFGITLAQDGGSRQTSVFYESDARNGDIIRLIVTPAIVVSADVIATGFAVNGGAPGTELGPGGLQYEPSLDRLWVVDGANNTIVVLNHVSEIPSNGVTVASNGLSFSGPSAHHASLVYWGKPLNWPISSALLPNGNIVVGNTGPPNGFNLMIEVTPHGKVVSIRNVDKGPAGAIFGMVATGSYGSGAIYFNDDNTNSVVLLSK